jgi:hypothetical protein
MKKYATSSVDVEEQQRDHDHPMATENRYDDEHFGTPTVKMLTLRRGTAYSKKISASSGEGAQSYAKKPRIRIDPTTEDTVGVFLKEIRTDKGSW